MNLLNLELGLSQDRRLLPWRDRRGQRDRCHWRQLPDLQRRAVQPPQSGQSRPLPFLPFTVTTSSYTLTNFQETYNQFYQLFKNSFFSPFLFLPNTMRKKRIMRKGFAWELPFWGTLFFLRFYIGKIIVFNY